jgi:hypothetical protein
VNMVRHGDVVCHREHVQEAGSGERGAGSEEAQRL